MGERTFPTRTQRAPMRRRYGLWWACGARSSIAWAEEAGAGLAYLLKPAKSTDWPKPGYWRELGR
jgi:hypothetical protein